MLSLTLIFRNFHLAARGADRWRQVPQPTPQPSEFVCLTAGTSRIEPSVPRETTKVSREGLVSALLAATEKAARRDPISRRRRGSSAGPMVRIRLPPAEIVSLPHPLSYVEIPAFRGGVRGGLGDRVGVDACSVVWEMLNPPKLLDRCNRLALRPRRRYVRAGRRRT